MTAATESLLERDAELAEIDAALARVVDGDGSLVAIEGTGGIGKSRLLGAARERAAALDIRVLAARASELERSFSFGVVRQLLESTVLTAPEAQRSAWLSGAAQLASVVLEAQGEPPGDDAIFPRLHGLYWLSANLATERPLLLTVDDVQWADESSLAFMGFLGRRLEGLPIGLVAATRPVGPTSDPLAAQLLAEPTASRLRPRELSVVATTRLVRARISPTADSDFCGACHLATAGNPFLLDELLREVIAEGIEPVAANAASVLALEPKGISRVVLLRLARLPGHARRLAHAIAVLGDGAAVRDAGELAELDGRQLVEAHAALVGAEIIEGREAAVHFVHPIVRNTLYEDIEPLQRSRAHAHAARSEHRRGAPADAVSAHLLLASPAGDAWVVERLHEAARRALGLGDPELAARLLTRALDEPPAERRAAIVAELARAEARAGRPSAAEHFREAIAAAVESRDRVLAARDFAGFLMFGGHPLDAVAVLRSAHQTLTPDERELAVLLQVSLIGAAYLSLAARSQIADIMDGMRDPGRPPASPLEAVHLAGLALDAAMGDGPAEQAIAIASRALAPDLPTDPTAGGNAFIIAVVALVFGERLSLAHSLYTGALDDARARGNVTGAAAISALRAMAAYRRGSVLDAEADANAALESEDSAGLREIALAYAILSAVERDATPAQLDALAADPAVIEDPDAPPYTQLLYARGILARERGDLRGALAIFRSFDRPEVGWELPTRPSRRGARARRWPSPPSVTPARPSASPPRRSTSRAASARRAASASRCAPRE